MAASLNRRKGMRDFQQWHRMHGDLPLNTPAKVEQARTTDGVMYANDRALNCKPVLDASSPFSLTLFEALAIFVPERSNDMAASGLSCALMTSRGLYVCAKQLSFNRIAIYVTHESGGIEDLYFSGDRAARIGQMCLVLVERECT